MARLIEDGLFHHKASIIEAEDDDLQVCDIGVDTDAELNEAIDK